MSISSAAIIAAQSHVAESEKVTAASVPGTAENVAANVRSGADVS